MSPKNIPQHIEGQRRYTIWLPLLIGVLLCAIFAFISWELNQQALVAEHRKIEAETEKLANYIATDMRNRIQSLQRLVKRWQIHSGLSQDEFVSDVQNYIDDMPGFQAIEWVDESFHVRWVVPLAGNEAARNLNLAFEAQRRFALETARDSGSPTMTPPIDLVQGGKGFLIYFPIVVNGRFEGFVLAVFRVKAWLDHILLNQENLEMQEGMRTLVSLEGPPIYKQTGWENSLSGDWDTVSTMKIMGRNFAVQCRPTPAHLEQHRSRLPLLVAIAGLFLSVILSVMVYLFRKAKLETRKTYLAKTALEAEIQEHQKTEEELKVTYNRLNLATHAGKIGIWNWDIATDEVQWNEIMYELYGVSPDVKASYEAWLSIIHPEDIQATEDLVERALQDGARFDIEFRILRPNGSIRNIQCAGKIEKNASGEPQNVIGINWDITDLKQAISTLTASEEQVRLLLNSTAEAIYGIDGEGNCTFANSSCLSMLGMTDAEQVIGRNMHQLIHYQYPDGSPMPVEECRIFKALQNLKGIHCDDEVLWRSDGTGFHTELWSHPQIIDEKIVGAVVTFTDITERKKAEEKIKHLATHDALTDLPNLKLAHDRISMAVAMARRNNKMAAVLFIDLDGFKKINDSHGHGAGDALLMEVARRLLSSVRETDTIARIGGDEFLGVLSELSSPGNASKMAEKAITLVSQPFSINGIQMAIGASIGIALYPAHGQNVEELIKQADNAMYEVKKAGKNGYKFAGPAPS